MKKVAISLVLLLLIIVGSLVGGYFWFENEIKPVSHSDGKTRIVIAKGSSAQMIANQLYKEGIIRNPLAFKLYVQINNKSKKIQPGEFNLSPNMKLTDVVNRLMQGPDQIWITIPEGLRKEEIVLKYLDSLNPSNSEFYADFLKATKNEEGYLFPETYLFSRDISAQKAIDKMTATYKSKTADLTFSGYETLTQLSDEKIITVASLIEREAKKDEERPIIAGIIYNRLIEGWPLQIDASIQYGIAGKECSGKNTFCTESQLRSIKWWPQLTKDDLETTSPYNTYTNTGLPLTPICNPGLSSIQAAYHPQVNDYWFYLHDNDGNIHYAKTIEEHNQNIAKYLGK
jgi:UPF0755 protein